jgi:hypothetical protein
LKTNTKDDSIEAAGPVKLSHLTLRDAFQIIGRTARERAVVRTSQSVVLAGQAHVAAPLDCDATTATVAQAAARFIAPETGFVTQPPASGPSHPNNSRSIPDHTHIPGSGPNRPALGPDRPTPCPARFERTQPGPVSGLSLLVRADLSHPGPGASPPQHRAGGDTTTSM